MRHPISIRPGPWTTDTPTPPGHFTHDLRTVLVSVGIVVTLFIIIPTIGGTLADWAVGR